MRKTERDAGWGAAGLLGILLLGSIGCTKVLEHQVAPASPEADAASSTVAARGFLSDFPTEPPAGSDVPAAVAAQPSTVERAHEALEPKLRVHEIQLANRGGRQALILVLSRPPDSVRSFVLHDPNRVVLDLEGPLSTTPPRTHAVAANETEAAIARKFGIKLGALQAANPGVNPAKLRVGQILNIPSP